MLGYERHSCLSCNMPDLQYLSWLDRDFKCFADFPSTEKFDEPVESFSIAFNVEEPD